MNARETLKAATEWLGWNDENMSSGLRNAFDALRLYDYAQANPDLPEMADEWEEKDFIAAIGYSPFAEPNHEATATGAALAAEAMQSARTLLDSVAFVSAEGDTVAPLEALSQALGADSAPGEPAQPAQDSKIKMPGF